MKRATLFLPALFVVLLLAACSEALTNTPTVTGPPLVVPTAPGNGNPSPAPTDINPSPNEPTPTEAGAGPTTPVATETPVSEPVNSAQGHFFDLYFMPVANSVPVTHYANGQEEVFAFWQYAEMTAGDVVRRVWHKDGVEWLVREENWDVDHYGASGLVNDISVYDFEGAGLEAGFYELTLYINDIYQVSGSFVIQASDLAASQGAQRAWVEDGTRLMWQTENGSAQELLQAENPITELLWHPAGTQLFFVTELPPAADGPPWPGHVAWQYDIASAALTNLSAPDLNINRLNISPDGRYLNALAGSDFGDACFMDRTLYFMDLADVNVWLDMDSFGIELADQPYWFFPADAGKWISPETFAINLTAYCIGPEISPPEDLQFLDRYEFDLDTLTVRRAAG